MSDVTLKEYFEKILVQRSESHDKAMNLFRSGIDKRLDTLNALRADVIHDREHFVLKTVYEPAHKELERWKELTEVRLNTIETRAVTWTAALGIFFTILQVALGVIVLWFHGK